MMRRSVVGKSGSYNCEATVFERHDPRLEPPLLEPRDDAERLFDDLVAEQLHEARFLCDRDEFDRGNPLAHDVPAHQRLEAEVPAVGHIALWLEDDADVVAIER
jgi:hypothetical protein